MNRNGTSAVGVRWSRRFLTLIGATCLLIGPAVDNASADGYGTKVNEFHDASGKLTVSVFSHVGSPAQQHWNDETIMLPDSDMVAVGGGGTATDAPPGALLTASYPNADLSGWVVSSKDHVASHPHNLTTYVIGLKVQGMSRDELKQYVATDRGDSGAAPHPEKSVGLASNDYVMLGGGFKVDYHGSGNMATASFPSARTTWTARSKDHLEPDPANLTTWVIGIRRFLPVGEVLGHVTRSDGGQTPHPRATATVPNGYVLTGGGGDIHYSGGGNMLWSLQPTTDFNQYFTAAGKDHLVPDPASITAYALSIRIR